MDSNDQWVRASFALRQGSLIAFCIGHGSLGIILNVPRELRDDVDRLHLVYGQSVALKYDDTDTPGVKDLKAVRRINSLMMAFDNFLPERMEGMRRAKFQVMTGHWGRCILHIPEKFEGVVKTLKRTAEVEFLASEPSELGGEFFALRQ